MVSGKKAELMSPPLSDQCRPSLSLSHLAGEQRNWKSKLNVWEGIEGGRKGGASGTPSGRGRAWLSPRARLPEARVQGQGYQSGLRSRRNGFRAGASADGRDG